MRKVPNFFSTISLAYIYIFFIFLASSSFYHKLLKDVNLSNFEMLFMQIAALKSPIFASSKKKVYHAEIEKKLEIFVCFSLECSSKQASKQQHHQRQEQRK
jgi:hypothetical protein